MWSTQDLNERCFVERNSQNIVGGFSEANYNFGVQLFSTKNHSFVLFVSSSSTFEHRTFGVILLFFFLSLFFFSISVL